METIKIKKTTIESLKELADKLDFMEAPKDYDPNYDELILAMIRYISRKTRKPLIS